MVKRNWSYKLKKNKMQREYYARLDKAKKVRQKASNGFLAFCNAPEIAKITGSELPVNGKWLPNSVFDTNALMTNIFYNKGNTLSKMNGFYVVDNIARGLTIPTEHFYGGVGRTVVPQITNCTIETLPSTDCQRAEIKGAMKTGAKSFFQSELNFSFNICARDLLNNSYLAEFVADAEDFSRGVPREITDKVVEYGIKALSETLGINLYSPMANQVALLNQALNKGNFLAGYTTDALATNSIYEAWLSETGKSEADITQDVDLSNKEDLARILDEQIALLFPHTNSMEDMVIQMSYNTFSKLSRASVCCFDRFMNPYSTEYKGLETYKGIPIDIVRFMDDDIIHVFYTFPRLDNQNPYIFMYNTNVLNSRYGLTVETDKCGRDTFARIYTDILNKWGVLNSHMASWVKLNDTSVTGRIITVQ